MGNYKVIHGWFTFDKLYSEIVTKFGTFEKKNYIPKPATFVEIGSWMGKSSCFMAENIKAYAPHIKFYCVDIWTGSPHKPEQQAIVQKHGGSIYKCFLHNMADAGVLDYVVPLQLSSLDAVSLFKEKSLDFVFVDGDHRAGACLADMNAWWPKLKSGGVLAGHDIDLIEVYEDVVKFINKNTIAGIQWLHDQNCWRIDK